MEVLLQKSSLTLTAIALVPVLAMAFGLTVPGIVSDIATVTKGAGPWRSVNCEFISQEIHLTPFTLVNRIRCICESQNTFVNRVTFICEF